MVAVSFISLSIARETASRGPKIPRMIAFHEFHAVTVAEHGAVSAQRFGNEKRPTGFMEQRRGMELNELHVCDHRAGAIGHGEPVSGGDGGVRRMEIYLACTTGCKEGIFDCSVKIVRVMVSRT